LSLGVRWMNPWILSILPAIAASGFIPRKSASLGGVLKRGIVTVGRVLETSDEAEDWARAVLPPIRAASPSSSAGQRVKASRDFADEGWMRFPLEGARLGCKEPKGRLLCFIIRTGLCLAQRAARLGFASSERVLIPRSRTWPGCEAGRRRSRVRRQCDKPAIARV